jgi:hypothetical protein
MEELKFLPYRDSNSDPSVVLPVASRYTDYITALDIIHHPVFYLKHNVSQTVFCVSGHVWRDWEKSWKKVIQDNKSPSRNLNTGFTE